MTAIGWRSPGSTGPSRPPWPWCATTGGPTSYSEDPAIVRDYAGPLVCGIQGAPEAADLLDQGHVLACAKHYLGDGGTTGGVDQGDTEVDEATLIRLHAQGYVTALAAGAQTVMASFSSWNGEKMHGHTYLLTDVLRGPLGFDGFVVGDWNGHGQLPGCSNEQSAAAIMAGVDMIMVPHDWRAFIDHTLAQVASGEIPMARIDEAVTRILRVKMRWPAPPTTRGVRLSGAWRADRRCSRTPITAPSRARPSRSPWSCSRTAGAAARGRSAGAGGGREPTTWDARAAADPHVAGYRDDAGGLSASHDAVRGDLPGCVGCGGVVALSEDGADAGPDWDVVVAVIGEEPYAEGQGDGAVGAPSHAPSRRPRAARPPRPWRRMCPW